MVEKLWRIEIVYFLPSCLWDLVIIITYSSAKKYVMLIFSSRSKRIFSHCSKLISQLTEAAFHVFLGKGILKICRNLKENTHAEVQFQ